MQHRPADLPDYRRPPLVEVVLGIQFSEIRGLGNVHIGLFWQNIKAEFPNWSEQPTLPVLFEVFGGADLKHTRPQIETFTTAPMNRFWFTKADDSELIQLQNNRFLRNWRKIRHQDQDGEYRRYEPIREAFHKDFNNLESFLISQGLGPIEPNQCEVTYMNHFEVADTEGFAGAMARLFGHWQKFPEAPESNLDTVSTDLTFKLFGSDKDIPLGRLHVSIKPAYLNDGRPIVVMQLVGRGRPINPDINGCLEFMDIARRGIVEMFTQLTSEEMHRHWERLQ